MYNLQFTIKSIFLIFIFYILHFTFYINPVYAQTTNLDASYGYKINDTEAEDGDILIYTDKGLMRANSAFSTAIFGVKDSNPLVVIELNEESTQSVVRSGITKVNVTTLNGPIKKGDYLTSSPTLGKGQKADKSGYMLGIALTDFSENTPGKVDVALDIKYVDLYSSISPAANRFLKSLDSILLASIQDPEKFTRLIRYLAASVIMLGAFIISFLTFSRSMANSVEAIGRNPLAKKAIYLSLIINMIVTIATLLVGLITAFILIKL